MFTYPIATILTFENWGLHEDKIACQGSHLLRRKFLFNRKRKSWQTVLACSYGAQVESV